jgi:prolyl-tRNA editing enzyme YbaK/EbsC (Cys-tRNA(Pro) deacylase)
MFRDSIYLASPKQVWDITGCEVGGVPPFGHKTKLKTYMDIKILENEKAAFNAGLRTRSVIMQAKDLPRVVDAELGDFSM